jgi:acyl carrier protein
MNPSNEHAAADALRAVWTSVLGSEPSAEQDFFEAGGDSLAMVQVLYLLEERTGLDLTVEDLFPETFMFGDSVRALEAAMSSAAAASQ